MRKLFLVRHGVAVSGKGTDELSEEGVAKVTGLAGKIRYLADGTSYVLASPLRRAQESARIIADALGSNIETVDYLSCEGDGFNQYRNGAMERMMEIIDKSAGSADNLIVVSHSPVITEFMPYFVKERGVPRGEKELVAHAGEGYCIDLTERKILKLE